MSDRARDLVEESEWAYAAVLEELDGAPDAGSPQRDRRIGVKLAAAADAPLARAEVAADVVDLAADAAGADEPVRMGVGLNSGNVMSGNVGSPDRME